LAVAALAEPVGFPTIAVTVKTWPPLVVRMAVIELAGTVSTLRDVEIRTAEELAAAEVKLATALEVTGRLELVTEVELATLLEVTGVDELEVTEVELELGVTEADEVTDADEVVGTADEVVGALDEEVGVDADVDVTVGVGIAVGVGEADELGVTLAEVAVGRAVVPVFVLVLNQKDELRAG
jgi:hypothetical protein